MRRPQNMMEVNTSDTGSHRINYNFCNVGSLERGTTKLYSPYFYLCNIGWKLAICKQNYGGEEPYLEICFERVENKYELQFSCEIKYECDLLNHDSSKNIFKPSHTLGSRSKFICGVRDHESMGWRLSRFTFWDELINPYYGYVDEDDDNIQLSAHLEIVKIYSHKEYCRCRICS